MTNKAKDLNAAPVVDELGAAERMPDIHFRCSQLASIMPKSSGLTEKQEAELQKLIAKDSKSKKREELQQKKDYKPEYDLSEGAKTYVKSLVKQYVFGYKKNVSAPQTDKGTLVEPDSIKLFKKVKFKPKYKKNEERKRNGFIQGECDIYSEKDDIIIDIKSSYDLESFPATTEDIDAKQYEWQLRGYMMLWGASKAKLAYCMVTTPISCMKRFANIDMHYVDHIEEPLRVTCSELFYRDEKLEEDIRYKVTEARRYAQHYYKKITDKY